MTDLFLNPTTGDLDLTTGQAQIVSDAAEVAQRIRIRLRTFLGDWFLDEDLGIPYLQEIIGQKRRFAVERASALLRAEILDTPGVLEIVLFTLDFDAATRTLTVTFQATTIFGTIGDTFSIVPDVVPDAEPADIVVIGTSESTDQSVFTLVGGITLDAGGAAVFKTLAYVTDNTLTGEIQLYNLTDATQIVLQTITATTPTEQTSAVTLPSGAKQYEVRMRVIGAVGISDRIHVESAALEI